MNSLFYILKVSYKKRKGYFLCWRKSLLSRAIFETDRTSTGNKILVCNCSKCKRENSIIVNYDTIEDEVIGHLFKNVGKISAKRGKKKS